MGKTVKLTKENKKEVNDVLKRFSSISGEGVECEKVDNLKLLKKLSTYMNTKGEFDIFDIPVFTVSSDSYRYVIYDSNSRNKVNLRVTTGISHYEKGDLLVHYADIILMACSVIKPSPKLRKMVSDYLGIDNNLNKIKDTDLVFPTKLVERSIKILDMNTDISFGIQLFTVLYNQCKVKTNNLEYIIVQTKNNGEDLVVAPLKADYIPLFKEIRNCNKASLNRIAGMRFDVVGNDVSDERLGYSILECLILGTELEFPTAKCMEMFANRELDLSTIKSRSMRDYTSHTGEKSLIASAHNIVEHGNYIGDSILSGAECDAITGIFSRPIIPVDIKQSFARVSVIENYLYGIFGDIIRTITTNDIEHRVASMIAETTRDLTGSAEQAYLDYFYTSAISRTLVQKYNLLMKTRELYVKMFDNIFNSKVETVSVVYLKEVTASYESVLKDKQLVINSLEDIVNKLAIQVQELSEAQEVIEDIFEEVGDGDIFISKNINELNICIVAELTKTKYIETLAPLFNKVTILDSSEALKHDFKGYDYVIFRGDLISHAVVYKIKSDNKRVIYVEKPDARNWLPTIMSRIN